MNSKPSTLCIGLPVFNGEDYLEAALDSLLGQTYTDFELILSDNASTDGTQSICQEYAARDRRIRYRRHEKNTGAAENWYSTFDLCSAEYFKWASDDDVYAPEFLQECIAVLEQNPAVVLCYSKTKVIDESGKVVRNFDVVVDTTSPEPHARLYNMIDIDYLAIQMYGVFRASTLRKVRYYKGYVGWDRNLLAELCLHGQVCEVPEHLFFHRLYPQAWGAVITSDKSQEEKLEYDPTINWHSDFSLLKRYRNYFTAVARPPLSPQERLRCHMELVRILGGKSAKVMRHAWNTVRS